MYLRGGTRADAAMRRADARAAVRHGGAAAGGWFGRGAGPPLGAVGLHGAGHLDGLRGGEGESKADEADAGAHSDDEVGQYGENLRG